MSSMAADATASWPDGAAARGSTGARNAPHLPTPLERAALAVFPALLALGTVFSLVWSHDAASSAAQASYFARKSNVFNVVFVKRGWAWTTLAFAGFAATHPSFADGCGAGELARRRRARAGLRWAAATAWWFLFTQWCLGPPIIDRGFRWTGGRCELARRDVHMAGQGGGGGGGGTGLGEALTAVACKAAGGRWNGGHDISGHVFLLVLGTVFLLHEVGWPALRWSGALRDDRCVVMRDGAVKGAGVEAAPGGARRRLGAPALGPAGKLALGVAGLNLWMLLMTAIYFHTWFEKLTGLLAALLGYYLLYVVPRFVPALRAVVGLPGI